MIELIIHVLIVLLFCASKNCWGIPKPYNLWWPMQFRWSNSRLSPMAQWFPNRLLLCTITSAMSHARQHVVIEMFLFICSVDCRSSSVHTRATILVFDIISPKILSTMLTPSTELAGFTSLLSCFAAPVSFLMKSVILFQFAKKIYCFAISRQTWSINSSKKRMWSN